MLSVMQYVLSIGNSIDCAVGRTLQTSIVDKAMPECTISAIIQVKITLEVDDL